MPCWKPGPVLGIETSCDETAAAVLAGMGTVLAEAVHSQLDHTKFGGVVPEVAARAHLAHLPGLVAGVLASAGLVWGDLAAVAATTGPGLIGGLIVGSGFGKGAALARGLPFVAINHLEAHALTARLPGLDPSGCPFPYLLLLVSGGHCQCVAVDGVSRYRRLGGTLDDAVGEAFDKAGKLLGLPWPGGPALERLAEAGDPARAPLPRPMLGRPGCDFSFSGLKTAVAQRAASVVDDQGRADIAAGFQAACAEVLADRARNALGMMPDATRLVVAGGVAANRAVRAALAKVAARAGLPLVAPPLRLCGDNAVMVAWAGIERLRIGAPDGQGVPPTPRWPLDFSAEKGRALKAVSAGIAATIIGLGANAGWAQPRQGQPPTIAPAPATPGPAGPPAATPPPAPASQAGSPPAGPQAASATASGWVTTCAGISRQGSQDCTITQSVQLSRTGQFVARVSVRVPGDTRAATMLVELPLGLFLPAGVRLQVDDGKPSDLQFQTCQAQGCLASAPMDAEVLSAMKTGKQFTLATQFLNREPLSVAIPLEGFSGNFERVQ